MKKKLQFLISIVLIASTTSCEKLLDDRADNQISDIKDLLQTPEDAQNVLNGAYDVLVNALDGQAQVINELLSNNAGAPISNDRFTAVYDRATNSFNTLTNPAYDELYRSAFRANMLLSYAKDIEGISEAELAQIESEARFIRAMAHFWALKVYAQPWGYTPDNSHLGIVLRKEPSAEPLARSTAKESFEFIQADLIAAYENLPETNGAYATKYSAAALLAYTYFLQNDFSNCKNYCDIVINSGQYSLEPTLDTFHALDTLYQLVANPEMIFGGKSNKPLLDVRTEDYTNVYRAYSVQGATLSLSAEMYEVLQNNPLDNRKDWTQAVGGQYQLLRFGTPETNGAGVNFFDLPVLRLTMIMLIRAESCGELGSNLSVGIDDINAIRERAFSNQTQNLGNGASASEIIDAARLEFRKEMVGEGYWIDQLKRRGARGENIVVRGAPWSCNGMLIQYPQNEGTGVSFIFNAEGGCN